MNGKQRREAHWMLPSGSNLVADLGKAHPCSFFLLFIYFIYFGTWLVASVPSNLSHKFPYSEVKSVKAPPAMPRGTLWACTLLPACLSRLPPHGQV